MTYLSDGVAFLRGEAEKIGVYLTHAQTALFMAYKDILLEWNKKINLTAITDERDIILKHFIDSLTVWPHLPGGALDFIDVGSGAGFPGIPLKIARPDIRMTLLDSTNKKITFLNAAINTLELTGTAALHARAEEAGRQPDMRGRFDIAVARAVAPLGKLAGYCLPFIKKGGLVLALKGPGAQGEAADAAEAIKKSGGEVVGILPAFFAGYRHYIAVIQK